VAKGFKTARDAFAEIEARKNSGGGGFGPYFKLAKSGDTATVRPLDAEVDWAWVHELPAEAGKYSKTELCRDQDLETGQRSGDACPGCDKEYRRKMQGIVRLIQRDAPVYEQDATTKKFDYNKVVGNEDQVVRWTVGKVVLEDLDGLAATFGDLNNRDYTVTRKGTGLDTSYDIKPVVVNGETNKSPLSDNDKKLDEDSKEVEFKIPSFEDWGKAKKVGNDAPATTVGDKSPFKKRSEA
jgi:hypothetical protein